MGNEAPKPGGVITPPANAPVVTPPANTVVPPEKPADAVPPVVPPVDGAPPPDPNAKPPEKPNEAAGVPESYDLKMPENSLLSQAHVDALKAYAKESGLSNDAAQKLLQREHNAAEAGIDSVKQRSEQQSQTWLAEAKADKEIGGDKFPQTVELANHALNTMFPGVEIRKFMDATGFGNNPVVLRGFAKIGRMLKPDSMVQPNGNPPPKKDPVKTMYDHPTSQPKS